jgi:PST family polysaccharide transporter
MRHYALGPEVVVSLRKLVFGTAAMSSVNVLRLLAQFFALPILSRILSPKDYGLVAIAMPFVTFAMVLADSGVGMSLVRTSASERGVWSTSFWLSIVLGLALALIMAACAPLVAHIFGEPRLTSIIVTLAFVVFAQSVCTIPGASLQQNHRFKLIAAIEVVSVACGIGLAVFVALHGGGAWALVGQQVAFFASRLTLTVVFSPFRPQLVLNWRGLREHLIFGRNILGANILGFFARSLDNLIIGKLLGAVPVGIYAMAFQFVRLPFMLVTGPLQYVLYAQLAAIRGDAEAVRRVFIFLTRTLAILVFPAMCMVAVAHGPFFRLLLSQKWAASSTLFMLVAPVGALQAVTALGGTVTMALGRTDIQLRTTIEFGILWVVALLTGAHFGLNAIAVAYDCAVLLYFPRSTSLTLPLVRCSIPAYLRVIATPVLITAGTVSVFWLITREVPLDDWVQLGLAVLLGGAAVVASILLQLRKLIVELGFLGKGQLPVTQSA